MTLLYKIKCFYKKNEIVIWLIIVAILTIILIFVGANYNAWDMEQTNITAVMQ